MAQPATSLEHRFRDSLFTEIVETVKLLPKKLRQVFIRSHYRGKDVRQISKELGIPEDRVRSLLKEANRIFYQHLHTPHPNA